MKTQRTIFRLGDLAAKKLGSLNPLAYPDEAFDLYSIPAFDSRAPEQKTGSEIGSAKQLIQENDVLLSRIVPHIRRAWVVGPDRGNRQIGSGEWIVFRHPQVHPDYLRHYFLADGFHAQFMQTVAGVGGSLLRARPSAVYQIEIPLPPLEDQKRIAALLDKADALRRKRQEALRLTDDFLRSTFLDLFGDPEKHGWPMETVEDMLAARPNAIRTGPFGSQLLHSEFVDSGIAVLGIDNAVKNEFRWGKPRFISEEKYEQLRRYTVHPGDVIITIMGTVGRCAIVPADIPTAINTKHLCCLTLDRSKCLPYFLHTYFLTHPIARRYLGQSAKGAIMDGLNMGLIKALPVPKVPLLLQQRFSDIANQVQKTALRSAKACQETETLFSALQQRAFSGEL